ncbi:MAG: ABC transporter substrate-binding protein [Flavobacteriales bacterium]|nr:ABC transporter substrate-binding protein [Flavobacteriales bacterium]
MFFFVACAPGSSEHLPCTQWTDVHNQYAQSFQIRTCGSVHQLIVFGPNGRLDTLAIQYVGDNADKSTSVIQPLQKVAVVSTTHLAYIHALGLSERVVGAAGLAHVMDPTLMNMLSEQGTLELGTADGLDREALIHLAPDALLDQPFGKSDAAEPLVGIPSIMISEYLEPHPLGRAEWVRFFGVLFGEAARSDSLFAAIVTRYTTVRDHVDATVAPTTVFFGSNWQGTWWVPGGKSSMSRLIADAGGALQFSDPESVENSALDLETLIHKGDLLKHWGMVVAEDGSVSADVLSAGERRLQQIRPFQENGLFAANSADVDIFGKALLEPDVLLLDLVKVFHPTIAMEHEASYYMVVKQQ